jgi:hypothetical protein
MRGSRLRVRGYEEGRFQALNAFLVACQRKVAEATSGDGSLYEENRSTFPAIRSEALNALLVACQRKKLSFLV